MGYAHHQSGQPGRSKGGQAAGRNSGAANAEGNGIGVIRSNNNTNVVVSLFEKKSLTNNPLQAANEDRAREAEIDKALVMRVQRGDQSAFDILVRKYQFRIGHLVARFLKDSADVEDVVQEAFIKAYRAIGGFRGDSAFYTWMYRIAINTSKNHLVALGRRPPAHDVEASLAEVTDVGRSMRNLETPEGQYRTAQLTEKLDNALDALPEELGRAIRLRELEGLSYEEIARTMSCPIGTVRSRIFRAREALDKVIQESVDGGS